MAQLLEFHGSTEEEYHALHLEVAPDGKLAAGALFHLGGPIAGGWCVVNVWEAEDAARAFFRDRLLPILERRGIAGPNSQFWWPVDNMMKDAQQR
jgi:hypothetical protein